MAGIFALLIALSISLIATRIAALALMLTCLTLGVTTLFLLFSSRWVERQMNKLIARALKRFTDLEVRDYQALLQLADGFAVSEMMVDSRNLPHSKRLPRQR